MTHTEHEDHGWTVRLGDHAQRKDTLGYLRSRKLMVAILKTQPDHFLGAGMQQGKLIAVQDHHGGGVHVLDVDGWRMYLLPAGVEYSMQFCADPARIDLLRQYALRLVRAFPFTLPGYEALGYHEGREILETPITDAIGVARWTDSVFNASVPLTALGHTGVLPAGGGQHHYPKPITDGDLIRFADFQLWVTDAAGKTVAVVPVAPRGSGDARVRVVHAEPGSEFHALHAAAHEKGTAVILPADHPLAAQAFSLQ
jgi:hypothetical protein